MTEIFKEKICDPVHKLIEYFYLLDVTCLLICDTLVPS